MAYNAWLMDVKKIRATYYFGNGYILRNDSKIWHDSSYPLDIPDHDSAVFVTKHPKGIISFEARRITGIICSRP